MFEPLLGETPPPLGGFRGGYYLLRLVVLRRCLSSHFCAVMLQGRSLRADTTGTVACVLFSLGDGTDPPPTSAVIRHAGRGHGCPSPCIFTLAYSCRFLVSSVRGFPLEVLAVDFKSSALDGELADTWKLSNGHIFSSVIGDVMSPLLPLICCL